MLGNWKRVLLLIVAGLCSLVVVTDVQAGLIFRRGQSRRAGVFARRSSNRSGPTTTTTATMSTAAISGATASGQGATTGADANLRVRGQTPEGAGANANLRSGTSNPLTPPPLPPPGRRP